MQENLLQVQKLSKSFGGRDLFKDVNFSVNSQEHIGVIGPNGAGKTTVFNILSQLDHAFTGEVVCSRKLSLAYLSQHDSWIPGENGNQYLERMSRIPLWELKPKGKLLGLNEKILNKDVLSLSGGYRMRIKLLGLLGQNPNLMLLDEPTNYLDLETTLVLERFLQDFDGSFLLISHDREFLRRTTDHILEIESGEITKYNGNIDDYFEQKELLRKQLGAKLQSQQEKRQQILDFVARFGASATKARQAQSKLKSLSKMEVVKIKPLPPSAKISIPDPLKTGKQTLLLDQVSFGYGKKMVLQDVSIQINRGDHIAVVGLNGAGKTTLLKGLSGQIPPLAGKLEFGYGVTTAIFSQHVVEALAEFANDSIFSALAKMAPRDVKTQEVLNLAGSLLFSGEDTQKKISILSGGEKSRVALAKVLLQRAPCLVLDEPTNHLDFETVGALANALKAYEGTVIVVSHDRGFIKEVGSKIIEVDGGKVSLYPGTYEEYIWKLEQREVMEEVSEVAVAPKIITDYQIRKKREREIKLYDKKIVQCENDLELKQNEIGELNNKISQKASRDLINSLSETSQKVKELENLWLELVEAREKLRREYE